MAGPNPLGTPNVQDYSLGRGIIYLATLDVNGFPEAWRDVGNSPDVTVTLDTETLEHVSSRSGLAVTDKEVPISRKVSVALTLDEINHENLSAMFSGGKVAHTNVAIAGFGKFAMIASVTLGRWYDIHNNATPKERAYDIETANLTLEFGAATLVEDTDYTLDLKFGRIFFLTTAVNVATGDQVDATLAADGAAVAVNEVQALTATSLTVAVKFISDNPADNGKQEEWQFHQVNLKAEGDLSLIGTEFTTMTLSGVAETNVGADPDSPTLTIREHANS